MLKNTERQLRTDNPEPETQETLGTRHRTKAKIQNKKQKTKQSKAKNKTKQNKAKNKTKQKNIQHRKLKI
jgi:hypothetical protein